MKINKSVLKNIIKECLIEILAEGMGNNIGTVIESKTRTQKNQETTQPKLTNPLINEEKTVSPVVQVIASNSIIPGMDSILEDTLKTTYAKQTSADRPNLSALTQASSVLQESVIQEQDSVKVSKAWSDIAFGK